MKYIDAERLKAEIERRKADAKLYDMSGGDAPIYDELLSLITSLQQERPEPTCKSCGFYENNCPFIRNTFKPYPNRACKDYTYSVMKEQPSLPSNLDEAAVQAHIRMEESGEEMTFLNTFKAGAEWMAGQISKAE